MRLSGQNVLHSRAVRWYYDVVAGRGPGVPEAILRHIRQCWTCRKQIHRLKEAVTGAGPRPVESLGVERRGQSSRGETDGGRAEMKRDIIDTLNLHFGCLEEQVTCLRVKPFLPGLLTPCVQIRIPTPITVHIDHCPECAADLEALRDLDLSAEQLERLEQLYEHETSEGKKVRTEEERKAFFPSHLLSFLPSYVPLRRGESRLCRRARARIADFVRGSLDDIDSEVLNHLSVCLPCRERVFRSRQKLLEGLPTGETGAAVCGDEIPMAQLFDYAVPYGRTTGSQERAGATHVHACRACLARIQSLDETIYGIAERTNSGIATVYSTREHDAQPAPQSDSQTCEAEEVVEPFSEPYPEYPIRVQVVHGEPEQATVPAWSPAEAKAALRHARCNPQVRVLLKTAVAAAAVILLTVLFRSTGSSTSGITLAQVFKAFGRAENVRISKFYPPTGQLTQDLWISRTLNLVVATTGQKSVLYDLAARKEYACQTADGTVETTELTDLTCASTHRLMATSLGFTPSDVPSNATWTRVGDKTAEGLEVYELVYSEQTPSGVIAFRKLTIVIDPATKLPRELQRFRRVSAQDQWNHQETTTVRYPTENEIEAVLEEQHHRSAGKTY
jgi:hypothetical protein